MKERRKDSREYYGDSLQNWLTSVAKKNKVESMVLSDDKGLLIAANQRATEAEELAAVAPILGSQVAQGESIGERNGQPMAVQRFTVGQEKVYLCATGTPSSSVKGLVMAAPGVERILNKR